MKKGVRGGRAMAAQKDVSQLSSAEGEEVTAGEDQDNSSRSFEAFLNCSSADESRERLLLTLATAAAAPPPPASSRAGVSVLSRGSGSAGTGALSTRSYVLTSQLWMSMIEYAHVFGMDPSWPSALKDRLQEEQREWNKSKRRKTKGRVDSPPSPPPPPRPPDDFLLLSLLPPPALSLCDCRWLQGSCIEEEEATG